MASMSGVREVACIDCAGGGQVRVEGTTAYVGHMAAPFGTSIFDVSDPASPRCLAEIGMPPGSHSHKVRAQDGLMLVNHERIGGPQTEGFEGGLGIYDVSRTRQIRAASSTGRPGARASTASISTGAMPTSRRRSRAMSATS